jgi:hypothetical protein
MKPPNNHKIILDLCGGSGSWSKPYRDAGYDVRLITLPEYDIRTYEPPENVYGILSAPPCTEFSIVKNHNIKRDLKQGMEIVDACMGIIISCNPVFWALENPVGLLKNFLGKPAYSFQPYNYGDGWTKKTLLWGDFNIPPKIYKTYEECPKINGLYIRPNRKTASIAFNHVGHKKYISQFDCFNPKTDAEFRAITPPAFAKAFYEVNQ